MCKLRHVAINTDEDRKTHRPPVLIKYLFREDRCLTDRYWTLFFIVIFIFCVASWHYDFKTDEESTGLDSSAEECHNETGDIVVPASDSKIIIADTPSEFSVQCWIFDTITCNFKFLDINYETIRPILIWANVVFCSCLIIYSLGSMRSDYTFCNQLWEFRRVMIINLLACRFLLWMGLIMFFREFCVNSGYKIVIFWIIPEALLITITAVKKSPKRSRNNSGRIYFRRTMKVICSIPFTFVGIFQILISTTAIYSERLDLDNPLYIATVGGSCYVSLTIFYFGMMVAACATGIALECKVDSNWILYLEAFYIIARYHFGTACYHATLIFPRLHATFVMNEAKFRKKPNFSIIKRFYATQWKLYNVSPIVTAVLGENYSGSIRELLHVSADDAPNVKYFQGFTEVCITFFVLLASVNSLIFTLLRSQGEIIDPRVQMGTWMLIIMVLFAVYTYMRAYDAILDTAWFHVVYINEIDIVDFSYASSTNVQEQYSDEDLS